MTVEAANPPSDPPIERKAFARTKVVCRSGIVFGLLVASASWLVGDRAWAFDLIAQVTAQIGVVSVVFAAWCFVRRRWALALVAGLSVVLAVAAIVPGRDLGLADVNPTRADGGGPVRVLVYNANAGNENRERVRAVVTSAQADVVGLLEAPAWLVDELREGGVWRERYPYYFVSDRAGAGFKIVLSRWPQHRVTDGRRGERFTLVGGLRHMLFDRPEGAFAFTLLHPKSPRTPERWQAGNEVVGGLVDRHRDYVSARGIAHVVASDLNATPSGSRSKALARAGLRRAKPLLTPAGTFPAWLPGPASIAIDDVVVSPRVVVQQWRTAPGGGSDHRAVVVDLWVPAPTGEVELSDEPRPRRSATRRTSYAPLQETHRGPTPARRGP
ncbi:MAG: endonuclease/exonuclease/phosphatase family protein [Planctomycetota bacterium]